MVNRLLLLALVLCLSARYAHATDYPAATCTNDSTDAAKIQTAITDATNAGQGNRVTIPAGTCLITTVITTPAGKSLAIQGAGAGVTILVRDSSLSREMMTFNISGSGVTFDLSGITCRYDAPDASDLFSRCFLLDLGATSGQFFRIHNNAFEDIYRRAFAISGSGIISSGLVDHNTFENDPTSGAAQMVEFRNCSSGYSSEDAVMSNALAFGTTAAVVFEANTVSYDEPQDGFAEGYACARYVLRFNHLHGAALGHHGAEGERGTQQFEYYRNDIDIDTFDNYTIGLTTEPVGGFVISAALNNNYIRLRTLGVSASQKAIPDGSYSAAALATWINANYPTIIASDVSGKVKVASRTAGLYLTILATNGAGAGKSVYATLGRIAATCPSSTTKSTTGGFCADDFGNYSGKLAHVRSGSGMIWGNDLALGFTGQLVNTVYRASADPDFQNLPMGPCDGTYTLTGVDVSPYIIVAGTKDVFSVVISGVTYTTTLSPPGSRTVASIVTEINSEIPQVTASAYPCNPGACNKIKITPTTPGVMRLNLIAGNVFTELGLVDNYDTNTGVGTIYTTYPAVGYACLDSPGWWFNRYGGYTAIGGSTLRAPNYYFLNRRAGSNFAASTDTGWVVKAEADWFNENGSANPDCTMATFNGTCGVGVGTAAQFAQFKIDSMNTCTQYVGYWVIDEGSWNGNTDPDFSSDQGRLYRCGASNNWTLYYTPLAYPHPMSIGVSISDISPAEGQRNSTVPITITGLGLNAASPSITVSGTGLTVSSLMVASDTSVTANFVMTAGATLGDRDVNYSNANGISNTKTFTILGASAPILDTINPGSGYRGTAFTVTITGSDMAGGSPSLTSTCTGVTISNLVVGGPTSLTATFTISDDAVLAACEVTLTTVDGPSNNLIFQPLATGAGPRGPLLI